MDRPQWRPDRRVMLPTGCFWAELKATGEKPTPAQLREHNRMRKMGERVEVLDSYVQIDEVLGKMSITKEGYEQLFQKYDLSNLENYHALNGLVLGATESWGYKVYLHQQQIIDDLKIAIEVTKIGVSK